uniref:Phosphoinositide 3-kinase regulatory subunit 5 n=1 Tax=Sinocyclocheilus anshuiensis TaxID=1608454 RepID=A0A671SIK9_9TELE
MYTTGDLFTRYHVYLRYKACTFVPVSQLGFSCVYVYACLCVCAAGWCMNRWSLEELVKRDPENFLILLQQILRKAREVQQECHYELVAPLALMFESTLLQMPLCPSDGEILTEACEVFHDFLAWPEPYCSVCRNLLSTLHQELRAPGISYHRLVREEQGLATSSQRSKITTVLLMNPAEVPAEVLSVAEQLSGAEVSQRESSITLIKHSYQAVLGTKYPLQTISDALQCLSDDELAQILSSVSDLLESAAAITDIAKAREHVKGGLEALREKLGIPASNGKASDGTVSLPTYKTLVLICQQDLSVNGMEDSTNDIANLLGMLDPWYERNTLSLLELPVNVVCQQTSKIDSDLSEGAGEGRLPIFADLVLYYCRHAARPALIQLYQAELTLAGGERRTEVFVHSLELGHTAGTRAIKAMGAASKRFGIDGDREAVPLSLEVTYNQIHISGRSQKTRTEKSCTSINLLKACRNLEELDSKMECLHLTMTEVLKRQNSKSKKGYNQQLTTTQVKVDKVQVSGTCNTNFAVCLDQDEKKILQSVTRCEVSVCYKPDSSTDWTKGRVFSSQTQPLQSTFCSLLCLPVATFSGPQP